MPGEDEKRAQLTSTIAQRNWATAGGVIGGEGWDAVAATNRRLAQEERIRKEASEKYIRDNADIGRPLLRDKNGLPDYFATARTSSASQNPEEIQDQAEELRQFHAQKIFNVKGEAQNVGRLALLNHRDTEYQNVADLPLWRDVSGAVAGATKEIRSSMWNKDKTPAPGTLTKGESDRGVMAMPNNFFFGGTAAPATKPKTMAQLLKGEGIDAEGGNTGLNEDFKREVVSLSGGDPSKFKETAISLAKQYETAWRNAPTDKEKERQAATDALYDSNRVGYYALTTGNVIMRSFMKSANFTASALFGGFMDDKYHKEADAAGGGFGASWRAMLKRTDAMNAGIDMNMPEIRAAKEPEWAAAWESGTLIEKVSAALPAAARTTVEFLSAAAAMGGFAGGGTKTAATQLTGKAVARGMAFGTRAAGVAEKLGLSPAATQTLVNRAAQIGATNLGTGAEALAAKAMQGIAGTGSLGARAARGLSVLAGSKGAKVAGWLARNEATTFKTAYPISFSHYMDDAHARGFEGDKAVEWASSRAAVNTFLEGFYNPLNGLGKLRGSARVIADGTAKGSLWNTTLRGLDKVFTTRVGAAIAGGAAESFEELNQGVADAYMDFNEAKAAGRISKDASFDYAKAFKTATADAVIAFISGGAMQGSMHGPTDIAANAVLGAYNNSKQFNKDLDRMVRQGKITEEHAESLRGYVTSVGAMAAKMVERGTPEGAAARLAHADAIAESAKNRALNAAQNLRDAEAEHGAPAPNPSPLAPAGGNAGSTESASIGADVRNTDAEGNVTESPRNDMDAATLARTLKSEPDNRAVTDYVAPEAAADIARQSGATEEQALTISTANGFSYEGTDPTDFADDPRVVAATGTNEDGTPVDTESGFIVYTKEGGIVDGANRIKAAINAGLTSVPVMIEHSEESAKQAQAQQAQGATPTDTPTDAPAATAEEVVPEVKATTPEGQEILDAARAEYEAANKEMKETAALYEKIVKGGGAALRGNFIRPSEVARIAERFDKENTLGDRNQLNAILQEPGYRADRVDPNDFALDPRVATAKGTEKDGSPADHRKGYIVVDSAGVVIDGANRLKAAIAAGETEVEILRGHTEASAKASVEDSLDESLRSPEDILATPVDSGAPDAAEQRLLIARLAEALSNPDQADAILEAMEEHLSNPNPTEAEITVAAQMVSDILEDVSAAQIETFYKAAKQAQNSAGQTSAGAQVKPGAEIEGVMSTQEVEASGREPIGIKITKALRNAKLKYKANSKSDALPVTFESDLDHAVFMATSRNNASTENVLAAKKVLKEAGMSAQEIKLHGAVLREALKKKYAKAAKDSAGRIIVPPVLTAYSTRLNAEERAKLAEAEAAAAETEEDVPAEAEAAKPKANTAPEIDFRAPSGENATPAEQPFANPTSNDLFPTQPETTGANADSGTAPDVAGNTASGQGSSPSGVGPDGANPAGSPILPAPSGGAANSITPGNDPTAAAQNSTPTDLTPKTFTYSDGKYEFVADGVGGIRVTNTTTGKVLSENSTKKLIQQYSTGFYYAFGPLTEGTEFLDVDNGDLAQYIADNSQNPGEVASLWEYEESARTSGLRNSLTAWEQAIWAFGLPSVTSKSFYRFGDRNVVNTAIARNYLVGEANSNGRRNQTIDQYAEDISSSQEIEISPQDVVDFMLRFPNGQSDVKRAAEGETPAQKALREKFRELTGITLNEKIAGIASAQLSARLGDSSIEGFIDDLYQKYLDGTHEAFKEAEEEYLRLVASEEIIPQAVLEAENESQILEYEYQQQQEQQRLYNEFQKAGIVQDELGGIYGDDASRGTAPNAAEPAATPLAQTGTGATGTTPTTGAAPTVAPAAPVVEIPAAPDVEDNGTNVIIGTAAEVAAMEANGWDEVTSRAIAAALGNAFRATMSQKGVKGSTSSAGIKIRVRIVSGARMQKIMADEYGEPVHANAEAVYRLRTKGNKQSADILINGEDFIPDAIFHEAGHIWEGWAAKYAPALYRQGMALVEQSPEYKMGMKLWAAVKVAAEKGKALTGAQLSALIDKYNKGGKVDLITAARIAEHAEDFADLTPEVAATRMKSEVLAMVIATGASTLGATNANGKAGNKTSPLNGKLRVWFGNLLKAIGKAVGIKVSELQTMTLAQFGERIAGELAAGELTRVVEDDTLPADGTPVKKQTKKEAAAGLSAEEAEWYQRANGKEKARTVEYKEGSSDDADMDGQEAEDSLDYDPTKDELPEGAEMEGDAGTDFGSVDPDVFASEDEGDDFGGPDDAARTAAGELLGLMPEQTWIDLVRAFMQTSLYQERLEEEGADPLMMLEDGSYETGDFDMFSDQWRMAEALAADVMAHPEQLTKTADKEIVGYPSRKGGRAGATEEPTGFIGDAYTAIAEALSEQEGSAVKVSAVKAKIKAEADQAREKIKALEDKETVARVRQNEKIKEYMKTAPAAPNAEVVQGLFREIRDPKLTKDEVTDLKKMYRGIAIGARLPEGGRWTAEDAALLEHLFAGHATAQAETETVEGANSLRGKSKAIAERNRKTKGGIISGMARVFAANHGAGSEFSEVKDRASAAEQAMLEEDTELKKAVLNVKVLWEKAELSLPAAQRTAPDLKRQLVDGYLRGKKINGASPLAVLPAGVRMEVEGALQAVRDRVDFYTEEMARRNDRANPAYAASLRANKGSYFKTSYEAFAKEGFTRKAMRALTFGKFDKFRSYRERMEQDQPKIVADGRAMLMRMALSGAISPSIKAFNQEIMKAAATLGVLQNSGAAAAAIAAQQKVLAEAQKRHQAHAKDLMENAYADIMNGNEDSFAGIGGNLFSATSYAKKQAVSPELQALMGVINDPYSNLFITLDHLRSGVATLDKLDHMKKLGLQLGQIMPAHSGMALPEGWERLPGIGENPDGSPGNPMQNRFGNLAGYAASPSWYAALTTGSPEMSWYFKEVALRTSLAKTLGNLVLAPVRQLFSGSTWGLTAGFFTKMVGMMVTAQGRQLFAAGIKANGGIKGYYKSVLADAERMGLLGNTNSEQMASIISILEGKAWKDVDAKVDSKMVFALWGQMLMGDKDVSLTRAGNALFGKGRNVHKTLATIAEKMYTYPDMLWKSFGLETERNNVALQVYGDNYYSLSPAEQEACNQAAASSVGKQFQMGSRVGHGVRQVHRKVPVGNFFPFQMDALRILANNSLIASGQMSAYNETVDWGKGDIGNKEAHELITKNARGHAVLSMAMYSGMLGAVGTLIRYMLMGDDDDKESNEAGGFLSERLLSQRSSVWWELGKVIKSKLTGDGGYTVEHAVSHFIKDYERNNRLLISRNEDGTFEVTNAGTLDPNASLFALFHGVAREGVAQGTGDALMSIVGIEIAAERIFSAVANRDFSGEGEQIYLKTQGTAGKIADAVTYIYKGARAPLFDKVEILKSKVADGEDGWAVAGGFLKTAALGSTTTIDPLKKIQSRVYKYMANKSDDNSLMRKEFAFSDTDLERMEVNETNTQVLRTTATLIHEDVRNARALNIPEDQIKEVVFGVKGVNKAVQKAILSGPTAIEALEAKDFEQKKPK